VVNIVAKEAEAVALVPRRVEDVLVPDQIHQLRGDDGLVGVLLDQLEHPAVLLDGLAGCLVVPDMMSVVALQLRHEALEVQ